MNTLYRMADTARKARLTAAIRSMTEAVILTNKFLTGISLCRTIPSLKALYIQSGLNSLSAIIALLRDSLIE